MMRRVEAGERTQLLGPLLPAAPPPGSQAGFHLLAEPHVGHAWITAAGDAAVVVVGREAWVMGAATTEIGSLLLGNGWSGTIAPAVSTFDPGEFFAAEPRNVERRIVYTMERAPDRPPLPDPLEHRPVRPGEDARLRSGSGSWVLSLWDPPSGATGAAVIVERATDRIVAVGGARTLSGAYAEIAAWIEPGYAGRGLLAAASPWFFRRFLDEGYRITALIRDEHEPAHRYATKVGWAPVGEETVYEIGDPRRYRLSTRMPWRGDP